MFSSCWLKLHHLPWNIPSVFTHGNDSELWTTWNYYCHHLLFVNYRWKSTFSFGKVPFRLCKCTYFCFSESWNWLHFLSTTQNEDIWEPQIWIWSRVDHVAGELRQSWAAAVVSCGTNRVVPGIAGSQLAEWGSPIRGISRWFVHRWYHLEI